MHSTLVLFVGLALTPALFVTLVPAQRAQEQARTLSAGWWNQDTSGSAGTSSREQETCLRDPSLYLFFFF